MSGGRAVDIAPVATPADVATARALFEEYAASLDVDLCFQGFPAELAALPGDYAAPRGTLLLARAGGEALGCVAVRAEGREGVAELKRLYVRPAARGLRVGRRLTEAALAFARAAGYARVCLDTLPSMGEAQRLYESLGFRDTQAYRYNPVAGTRFLELALDGAPANAAALRIGLISDTHGLLRPEALAFLRGCDHIVHGGDIGGPAILEQLRAIAPLTVVRGNNDSGPWAHAIDETALVAFGGVRVYALHDLAQIAVDPAALGIRVVVSGHSHRPLVREAGGVLYVNPGSAGPRRFALPIAVGELRIGPQDAVAARTHELARPA